VNQLPKRVAIVTGAASGIGRATAEALAAAGYALALVDLDANRAASVAESLGDDVITVAADVGDGQQVRAAAAAVIDKFGRADILITSAGHSEFVAFEEIDEVAWRRMLDVHLTGAFHCCQAVLPAMRSEHFGRIVFVASSGVMNGGSGLVSHYVAAKAGLIGLARALARELGPHGITVNCVAPGPIGTPLLERVAPERFDQYVATTPVGRLGAAADVARAIEYLVADEAEFVTGTVLAVNGGRTMW
jgi:NAD(P)-dependent dehydrogenase (short-subunit alcohol dehydrogenase family)